MRRHLFLMIIFLLCSKSLPAQDSAQCSKVPLTDASLKIYTPALAEFRSANLDERDIYNVIRIVSGYENGGCWNGATGDRDGQLLSVGVMHWNFGQGTLQPLLVSYRRQFPSDGKAFAIALRGAMPHYGIALFASCIDKALSECRGFLEDKYQGPERQLIPPFGEEVNALFKDRVMRQIQLDVFVRGLSSVLGDLHRVFHEDLPKAWQLAWAMDMKTQLGRFPLDKDIIRIKQMLENAGREQRTEYLLGVTEWYEGICRSGSAAGVSSDWHYNVETWQRLVRTNDIDEARQEALHFTFLVSRVANSPYEGGKYQADAFQRRATIVFGTGSVHHSIYYVAPVDLR